MGFKYLIPIILLITFELKTSDSLTREKNKISYDEVYRYLIAAKIQKTFMPSWLCLIEIVSNFDTNKKTLYAGRTGYGILQIAHNKYCNSGIPGGLCNARCEDFLKSDISNSIACAKKIVYRDGFKAWPEYTENCKKLPPFNMNKIINYEINAIN